MIVGKNIEIEQIVQGNESSRYLISYCGPNKEGKEKCNFYHIHVEKIIKNLFFIRRDYSNKTITKRNFKEADLRAYRIAKNISKLFYRDLVSEEIKNKVEIIDNTNYSKPSK